MTRRERLEAKLEKREDWAAGRTAKAEALRGRDEHLRGDWAFATQPGHIPERARMIRREDKAREHHAMAEHHKDKAAGLARQLDRSVFSDDDDAIEKLEERIAANEAKRERWKIINKLYKKADAEGLEALGLDLERLRSSVDAQSEGGRLSWLTRPCPSYEMTNLGARIRTDRKRIEEVKRRAAKTDRAEAAGGVVIETVKSEWSGETYATVTFAEKPEREIVNELKAAGFRWGSGSWSGAADRLPDSVRELSSMEA